MDWNAWLDTEFPKQREEIAAVMAGQAPPSTMACTTARDTTLWDICDAVEDVTGIAVGDILSKKRHQPIYMARRMAIKLAKERWKDARIADLGRAFDRDHTTISSTLSARENAHFDRLYQRASAAL